MLFIDFETYYDSDYSLRKLNPIDYVRDQRFKIHGAACKVDDRPAEWLKGDALTQRILEADHIIAHNYNFDGLILHEHFGASPRFRSCTMSIARGLLPRGTKLGLDDLGRMFKLGVKTPDVLASTKGVRNLSPDLEANLAGYAIQDAELCSRLYQKLRPHFPDSEAALLNLMLRGSTEGKLLVDIPLATEEEHNAKQRTKSAIEAVRHFGITGETLRSSQKFAEWLRSNGIEPPKKISPTTGEEAYALAKNDIEFKELIADHFEFKDVFEARMIAASSIDETRARALKRIGTTGKCTLPMPTKYCAAHTGRAGGEGGINVQNLSKKTNIRKCIIAPPGHLIVVADSAQIELRVNAWFCGQQDSLDILRVNGDIYSHTASSHFGYAVNKHDHPNERQFGKLMELGLGYGMGHAKFRVQAALGVNGVPPTKLSVEEAMRVVTTYRTTHAKIVEAQTWLNAMIANMTIRGFSQTYKCITFHHEAVELPNGLMLHYPQLDYRDGQWTYVSDKGFKTLYGGKLLENIIQALARIIVMDQTVELDKHPHTEVMSTTHDEAIALVPEANADEALAHMIACMSISPAWAPDLPTSAEGKYAGYYSK